MKKILFLSLIALTAVTACKKDSIGTKPQISFVSYSTSRVIASDGMDITFEVRDGDGDIENALNFVAIYDVDPTMDTVFEPRPMPDLGAHAGGNLKAEVVLHLVGTDFPQIAPNPITKDSVHYLVFVQDNAGNSSDTIVTPKIEVLYQ
ncbi:MAG TPA: hypothetical protein VJ720_06120 [Chitinophaga sp.]|nr:hypothetical protein [Chitinophaga sp.]